MWLALPLIALPSAWAQGDPDPTTLLREPLVKLAQAARSQTRFTYLDLQHTMNFTDKGKKTADTTQLFEVTYIGELQYSRLLKKDGKDLKGPELAAEQKRYDEAVKEHAALGDATRGKLFFTQLGSFGVTLTPSMVEKQYQNTIAGLALLPMCRCVMVDSTPLAGAPQRKYRMWVDPEKKQLLRMDSTLLADDGQEMKNGTLTVIWTYIDAVPLISQSHFDVYVRYGNDLTRVVADHTYSQFRKFTVTTTIVPDEASEKK